MHPQPRAVPVAAAVLLGVVPSVAAQLPGPDRIQNGDFESCALLPGWEPRQPITFDGSVTSTEAHSGTCSLRLAFLDIVQQSLGAQGVTHQGALTFWALAPTLPAGACLTSVSFVEYADGTRSEETIGCNTGWTELTHPLDRSRQVRLVGFGTPENPDMTLYVDDVELRGPPPRVEPPPELEEEPDERGLGIFADLCRFVFRGNETLCVLGLIVATLVGLLGLLALRRRRAG